MLSLYQTPPWEASGKNQPAGGRGQGEDKIKFRISNCECRSWRTLKLKSPRDSGGGAGRRQRAASSGQATGNKAFGGIRLGRIRQYGCSTEQGVPVGGRYWGQQRAGVRRSMGEPERRGNGGSHTSHLVSFHQIISVHGQGVRGIPFPPGIGQT